MVDKDAVAGVLESGAGEWLQIIILVFGGCCSNVWALESLLKEQPGAGAFLTCAQFLYVALQNVSGQLAFPTDQSGKRTSLIPRLKKRAVPLRRWMVQVVLFFAVNLMNNYALGMKIGMTIYIIFRSGGLCVSMIMGYLVAGKRYSFGQVAAGAMITTGVVIATMSAPQKRSSHAPTTQGQGEVSDARLYVLGVSILAVALVISALLGLWQEETYRRYGKQWREGLFYSHFLSLPFFVPMYSSISTAAGSFAASRPMSLLALPGLPNMSSNHPLAKIVSGLTLPSAFVALAINVVTQGICVRGVNRLTARVNSTTVNLVLTLRKAVSLAISVWFYGSGVTPGLLLGGALVLVGTIVYSMASSPVKKALDVPPETLEAEKVVKASAVEPRRDDLKRRAVS